MKEYADQFRGEIDHVLEGLPSDDELELLGRLGQLGQIKKSIAKFREGSFLDDEESKKLNEHLSRGYQSIRNMLPLNS